MLDHKECYRALEVTMPVLKEPDAFPAGDLGLRKAVQTGQRIPTASALTKRADCWRPWRPCSHVAVDVFG